MKKIVFFFAATALLVACDKKQDSNATETASNTTDEKMNFQVYGDSISAEVAISKEEMLAKYEDMKPTDTLAVKLDSEIIATCKKKGCWMTLKLGKDKEAFVKFKDYAFFVPKEGAENHRTIISGKAFIETTPVDELKHYAKDAGKTDAEIAAITEPKVEYRFMADGVLIAEN
ncbi:DUF4920 domain-containing protein [Flavobacterium sp. CBA20B-1]|uniref:DUF4920 domain-containing protein n=1 Tax=unclassified Flavobacterium TaxID=196869 RepID=UPI0022246A7B|nr:MULTISPECIES: DUF4920 domain-containing protein [unclassified Flavobacterium]WCM42999.1 DUF4920 domain-containing protein [Flavobacterium sp. CBA20B-1]